METNFLLKTFISNIYKNNLLLTNNSPIKEEYIGVFIYILFSIFLAFLIIVLSYFLVSQAPETEKLSSYECGFEPYEDTRNKFNVKFYIVAILFILFDIEIIFFLPWCSSVSQLNLLGFWSMIEFLLELCVGFVYIWSAGALEWD
jgi:NADH-quinone oxidoreductase subunit A